MKRVIPPPQLSLNFEQPACVEKRVDDPQQTCDQSISGNLKATQTTEQYLVIDLSAALRKKREARTELLYRQILDTVKHID